MDDIKEELVMCEFLFKHLMRRNLGTSREARTYNKARCVYLTMVCTTNERWLCE